MTSMKNMRLENRYVQHMFRKASLFVANMENHCITQQCMLVATREISVGLTNSLLESEN